MRPIFDWSEVDDAFPQAAPVMDGNLLRQVFCVCFVYSMFFVFLCVCVRVCVALKIMWALLLLPRAIKQS